jgi:hypothetical protein
MTITVRVGRKAFRRLVANDGAQSAFNVFRHELSDYDFKIRAKGCNRAAVLASLSAAVLELAGDLPGVKQAVADHRASH